MNELEIRSFGESAAPKLTNERTIEGYAVVFNQESRVIYDREFKRHFIEVIKPESISDELLKRSDVKALAEHNKERMLARSFMGKGTLELTKDDYGVKYRFDSPNTVDGDYVVEMVRRGDLFGSSFAFAADEKRNVTYSRGNDGILRRFVNKIDRFSDVSVVSNPAYMGTNVSVRSIEEVERSFEPDNSWKEELESFRNQINS